MQATVGVERRLQSGVRALLRRGRRDAVRRRTSHSRALSAAGSLAARQILDNAQGARATYSRLSLATKLVLVENTICKCHWLHLISLHYNAFYFYCIVTYIVSYKVKIYSYSGYIGYSEFQD